MARVLCSSHQGGVFLKKWRAGNDFANNRVVVRIACQIDPLLRTMTLVLFAPNGLFLPNSEKVSGLTDSTMTPPNRPLLRIGRVNCIDCFFRRLCPSVVC